MGFCAKGSPGAFLHLTEKSDARGGITDDTIFHSSMPHIFVEKEWSIATTGTVSVNWGDRARFSTNGSGEYVDTTRVSSTVATLRSGNIPADLQNYMVDSSNVLIYEAVYNIGGVEHRKILSGISLGNSGFLHATRSQASGNHVYEVNGRLFNRCTITMGIGVNLGLASYDSKGWLATLGNINSYGTNTYINVVEMKNFTLYGNNPWGHRDTLYGSLLKTQWISSYNSTAEGTLNVSTMVGGKVSPFGRFDRMIVSPLPIELGVGYSYGFASELSPWPNTMMYNNGFQQWRFQSATSYDGSIQVTESKELSDKRRSRSLSAPRFLEDANRQWDRGRADNSDDMIYYDQIRYNSTPIRIDVKLLNVKYSSSGYTVNRVIKGDEVYIGGGDMKLGGVSLINLNKKMLYQINPTSSSGNRNTQVSFVNYGYTNTDTPANAAVVVAEACTNNGRGVHSLGGNTNPASSNSIGFSTVSGTGWGCTSNTVFNSAGVFWGPGSIPLTLRNNSTARFSVGGQVGDINSSERTDLKLQQTIAMQLSTSRSSSLLFKITSTDPATTLNGSSWYSLGNSNNTSQCVQAVGEPLVESAHGLLVVPIGQYVPIIVSSGTTGHYYNNHARAGDHHDQKGSFVTTIFWVRNDGNGSLSVYSSHSTYKNPIVYIKIYGWDRYNPMPPTNSFKVPKFTLDVVKLS